jgi:Protein of unknown function (DUF3237)
VVHSAGNILRTYQHRTSKTPICEVHADMGERFALPGTPLGERAVSEVGTLRISGRRLNASLAGKAAADWLIVAPDRSFAMLDVRFTVRTDDDALIFVWPPALLGDGTAQGRRRASLRDRRSPLWLAQQHPGDWHRPVRSNDAPTSLRLLRGHLTWAHCATP